MASTETPPPEARARQRAKFLSGLIWHAGTFLIVNAFFWVIDLVIGRDGLQWSLWITAAWGFALAFHALGYLIDGRQLEERKTQQYLDEQRRRENI